MSKLLLFAVIVVIVYALVRSALRKRDSAARGADAPPAEAMVACVKCGVHLPRSEAVEAGGRFFCCEEHRRIAGG